MGGCVGFGKAPWVCKLQGDVEPGGPARRSACSVPALTESFNSYGFGWILGAFRGHRTISHAGYAGAAILRLPDDGVSVVVLTNLTRDSGSNPQGLARYSRSLCPGSLVAGIESDCRSRARRDGGVAAGAEASGRRPAHAGPIHAGLSVAGRGTSAGFQAEVRRLGTLESLTLLETNNEAGTQLLLYRAITPPGACFFAFG